MAIHLESGADQVGGTLPQGEGDTDPGLRGLQVQGQVQEEVGLC